MTLPNGPMPDDTPRGVAILVRYHGPTNYRGSRWIATADLPAPMGRVTIPYQSELGHGIDNAHAAALELVARWNADNARRYPDSRHVHRIIAGGHLPDGAYTFIAR